MSKVRVAIIGVGNCASSLVQGVQFYRGREQQGLRSRPDACGPRRISAGRHRVQRRLRRAVPTRSGSTSARRSSPNPNNTIRFAEVPKLGVPVHRGMTHDGLGNTSRTCAEVAASSRRHRRHPQGHEDRCGRLVPAGRLRDGDQVVCRAGARSRLRLRQLHAGLHRVGTRTGSKRFAQRGLPIIGDDIKSQVGATIVHRILTDLFRNRGVRLDRTYQLNFGGNTDFLNMLERERLESKKISKTQAVTSQLGNPMREQDVHVGPSDYVPWLTDRKCCLHPHGRHRLRQCAAQLRIEARGLGFAQLGGCRDRCDPLRQARARPRHRRRAQRPISLLHEVAAAAVHRRRGA